MTSRRSRSSSRGSRSKSSGGGGGGADTPQHRVFTVALGWFWFPEATYGVLRGVLRTRVGYSGGKKKNPTYHDLGDHSEALEVDYDPSVVTYEALLNVFFDSHSPTRKSSVQYRSAVFYRTSEEQKAAEAALKAAEKSGGHKLYTAVEPFTSFTWAEDYHQKFQLRQRPSIAAHVMTGKTLEEFVNSHVAARLNGYVNRQGSAKQLKEEIDSFGLPDDAKAALLNIQQRYP